MAEPKNRWTWDLPGFEPRRSADVGEDRGSRPLVRPLSVSQPSQPSLTPRPDSSKKSIAVRLQKLEKQVKHTRDYYLELRQEATDLKEYSHAKLDRVTRYLGVLADRARKLDQASLESEARITPVINEKKKLFNDLLTAKGNVKVYCRIRPLFEDEGPSIIELPDEYTVRVNTCDDSLANPKKDYEFDRVYGPHVGQGEFFCDVQPFVQSALDGYNVSIFAYGQSGSGKTYTMEGSSHERGLYLRSFEELFDLSNSDTASTSQYTFYVTAFELHNEQVQDLLANSLSTSSSIQLSSQDSSLELVQEKVDNPLEFTKVLQVALQNRGAHLSKAIISHLIVTIHIQYSNWVTRETLYSKFSLVDLPGSDCFMVKDATGDHITNFLHVSKSLSALGDVLNSLTTKKESIPFENSRMTQILADSLGGSSKTLLIAHVCSNASNLSKALSTLNFSARARNAELSLGNRDTIKKWKDVANDSRKELYEKEKEVLDLRNEVTELKLALKDANDQCIQLFNEVQKAQKASLTVQADLKAENLTLIEKHKVEEEQNVQLRNQVARLLQSEQEQKTQIHEHDQVIQKLQAKLKGIESQLNEALQSSDAHTTSRSEISPTGVLSTPKGTEDTAESLQVTKKLEEELSKRDALIEKLHQENEKLFDRLTEKSSVASSPQILSNPATGRTVDMQGKDLNRGDNNRLPSLNALSLPGSQDKNENTGALVKSSNEKIKTTPAGEYLTVALGDFDPDQFESFAAISDGANKLLMLVLAAVIKAGAAREHEILAEIRDAVFSFIRKMEPKRVMDTMLVSRVRILYIRSLLARSPELQSIKVSSVERFLEKANAGHNSSSRGNSPSRSLVHYDSGSRTVFPEEVHGFKVNIKQERKSKLSSIVLKLRGIDQETWRQHVSGGKLREITEEAKAFAIGNKSLAALFVHTPAGELQRQIRSWLAENYDFLSVAGIDSVSGSSTGQLELLSTAIMDGWMAGLGTAQPPSTDALGQLLSEYTKQVYSSQLQHLKDIAGTLATEEAEDHAHVSKLRSALESVDHKRKKILQQMRNDSALLTKEQGGSPIRNPSTAAEDARLASLISLDTILKEVKEIMRQTSTSFLNKSKRKVMLATLDELLERMPSLLDIDHPCAKKQILDVRKLVEKIPERDDSLDDETRALQPLADSISSAEVVSQWNVLQFNTGSTAPFIVKCGANSSSELVIKADARVDEPKGGEIIRVVPRPSVLADISFEEIKKVFDQLPEAISLLALARTADGTRARYSRLYRTLAGKVPSLKDLVAELDKGGLLKDVKT
ncbi:kinesin-like protein KIN-14L [Zingiber officinale]|uniref:kinesin-like protein KIN-14L n=1 Tax=Zingiber officinale TaxID=94328 RepID=UPI001C4B0FDA|nr:kinesin-like protein KIN-14L [Zingiber officinale]XP_042408909.1 kinesin-like protein KIN-14L [Zingiber officinale]